MEIVTFIGADPFVDGFVVITVKAGQMSAPDFREDIHDLGTRWLDTAITRTSHQTSRRAHICFVNYFQGHYRVYDDTQ
jgi:hypothetical protein